MLAISEAASPGGPATRLTDLPPDLLGRVVDATEPEDFLALAASRSRALVAAAVQPGSRLLSARARAAVEASHEPAVLARLLASPGARAALGRQPRVVCPTALPGALTLALRASLDDALRGGVEDGPQLAGAARAAFREMCGAAEALMQATAGPSDRLFHWLWRGIVAAGAPDWQADEPGCLAALTQLVHAAQRAHHVDLGVRFTVSELSCQHALPRAQLPGSNGHLIKIGNDLWLEPFFQRLSVKFLTPMVPDSLRGLTLSWDAIHRAEGPEGRLAVGKMLARLTRLTFLDLSSPGIADRPYTAARYLATGLLVAPGAGLRRLEELRLSGSICEDASDGIVPLLLEAPRRLPALRRLTLTTVRLQNRAQFDAFTVGLVALVGQLDSLSLDAVETWLRDTDSALRLGHILAAVGHLTLTPWNPDADLSRVRLLQTTAHGHLRRALPPTQRAGGVGADPSGRAVLAADDEAGVRGRDET